MKSVHLDESVLARPWPSLDESNPPSDRYQFPAYQEALRCLLNSEGKTVIHSIPAGAGSGKTRLLVAILNGLLRCGVPAGQIEAISFTNASANDFRRKHIQAAVTATDDVSLSLENICFSTIHQCALNVLKKLQPHIGGVGYYFEDSRTGGQDDEDEERRRAVRLALYASVVYGNGDENLLDKLARYAEDDERAFILEDLGVTGHLEQAKKLIREEMATDAGLGAFTNMAESGPDYCLAVATDALMRLYKAAVAAEMKRNTYGIPTFMAVDEAQDLDFLQLLFLRALALNGTSIILVGDSRQTLYEFRNSLSDYPFLDAFMRDIVEKTGIESRISSHSLDINYRCRKEIIEGAEEVSDRTVTYSHTRNVRMPDSHNIRPIVDPEHIARGKPHITDGNKDEKLRPAISVIVGEAAAIVAKATKPASNSALGGALGLLPEFANDKAEPVEREKSGGKRTKLSQVVALGGGANEVLIKRRLVGLFERARLGETAAIITRNGVRESDLDFIKRAIHEAYPGESVRLNLVSPAKHSPLSEYWFPDTNGEKRRQLPFSSLMVAGAMAFILSSDQEARQQLKVLGIREMTHVFVAPPDKIRERNDPNEKIRAIVEELVPFFKALETRLADLYPTLDVARLKSHLGELRGIVARFTYDVVIEFGRLMWNIRQQAAPVPCRFHNMACDYIKGLHEGMAIRPLGKTKSDLKTMWRALAATRFDLNEAERAMIREAGLAPEAMDSDASLLDFPSSLNGYCIIRRVRLPEVSELREMYVKERETIYDEFSRLWHLKTRTYMREIAHGLGRAVRANPDATEDALRRVVWDGCYQTARYKSRLSITYRPDKSQYGGLFLDLLNGIKKEAAIQRRGGKAAAEGNETIIDLTTIHSSKGLEWDHVIFYFPQPSPNDKDASFKSCRDLVYVAMTRAVRTLTIVLQKRRKLVESPTDTGVKILVELMHEWAEEKGYYNRDIDYGDSHAQAKDDDVAIYDETSHSELERSQTCRMSHYFADMRSVSTMVPLTAPSYAFFFHGTMSAICASIIRQRLPSRVDPSIEIAAAVQQIVQRQLSEDAAYRFFMDHVRGGLYTLMESMIPMYFLGDRSRHHALMGYYTEAFARHLAAIASQSKLFKILLEYRDRSDCQILIEKGIRKVLEGEPGQEFLPIVGIPDIKVLGPGLTYVADYKTVPLLGEDDDDTEYERSISLKTRQQVNYYQGMTKAGAGQQYLAELLYVADVTLFDYDEIPPACPSLPHIGNGPNFKIVAGVRHAKIVYTDRFDQEQFAETVQQISDLRKAYRDASVRPEEMFQAAPLVGEGVGEVSQEQCRHCSSGVHCPMNKFYQLSEVTQ